MAFFFGSVFGDTFSGGPGLDIFLTRAGIDRIETGDGFDIAFTGDDDDTLTSGSGFKILGGGGGVDVFRAELSAAGTALVLDFEAGDKIDVSNFGIETIDDVSFGSNAKGGTSVVVGNFVFDLRGVDPDSLTSQNFIFAEGDTVIDFDDLEAPDDYFDFVPNGFEGFNWTNFLFVETDEDDAINGFVSVSGDNIVASGNTGDATLASGEVFDFQSAVVGAGWHDGLEITITGFLNGAATGTQIVVIADATVGQFTAFDDAIFDAVDRVEFSAEGGEKHDGFSPGGGVNFWMDDIVIA